LRQQLAAMALRFVEVVGGLLGKCAACPKDNKTGNG
jgi:hypothetical protein